MRQLALCNMSSLRRKRRAAAAPVAAHADYFDVIIAGDMTHAGDRAFRVAQDVRHYFGAGLRVGLLQASLPAPGSRIAPEVQTCVRRRLADVVAPALDLTADLLIIHGPSKVAWTARRLGEIKSERTVLVCHRTDDYIVQRTRQRLRGSAEIVWAPTNPWLRQAAPAKLPLTPADWLPVFDAPQPARTPSTGGRPTVGWVASNGSTPAPVGPTEQLDVLALHLDGELPAIVTPSAVIGPDQPSLDRLAWLDALAYFPAAGETTLPDTMILAALNQGLIVALPEQLKQHYGSGPLYCRPGEALTRLANVLGDERARNRLSYAARRAARKRSSGQPADSKADTERPSDPSEPRPVMFLASNGVGVGHVSRLLAIARRLDPDIPVVFVTQAPAVGMVEGLGYLAEHIPSAGYIGGSFATWDSWFRFELERLIDAYDPALVVYDGNNPSDGLVRAVTSRRDCRLAWVRRGLWANTTSEFLKNSRWFDLILEPGELEHQVDEGVTARRRHEVKMIPPIRLLDAEELLSKDEAAKALGLDPARAAGRVPRGGGLKRDVVLRIEPFVVKQRELPQLQICVADWVNGAQSLTYWPDVRYVRGYPLSQYFRAFDFSVAAAGYNTFHEIISFGVPAIFIPNRHPSMDDQAGRAMHAQDLHAAFELEEEDLADLPELVTLLMDAKAREFLSQNCRRIRRPNGAREAAQSLTEFVRATT